MLWIALVPVSSYYPLSLTCLLANGFPSQDFFPIACLPDQSSFRRVTLGCGAREGADYLLNRERERKNARLTIENWKIKDILFPSFFTLVLEGIPSSSMGWRRLCARQSIFGIKNGMARRKASLLTAPSVLQTKPGNRRKEWAEKWLLIHSARGKAVYYESCANAIRHSIRAHSLIKNLACLTSSIVMGMSH